MGEYADVKRKRILQFLEWLSTQDGFSVGNGGNHQVVVTHSSWVRPFPIPFKHNRVNKYIVTELVKKIIATGVCTKGDIDERL